MQQPQPDQPHPAAALEPANEAEARWVEVFGQNDLDAIRRNYIAARVKTYTEGEFLDVLDHVANQIAKGTAIGKPAPYVDEALRRRATLPRAEPSHRQPPAANGNTSAGRIDYSAYNAPFDDAPDADPEFEQDPVVTDPPQPEPEPQPAGDAAAQAWPDVLAGLATNQPDIARWLAGTSATNGNGLDVTIHQVDRDHLDWLRARASRQVLTPLRLATGHRYESVSFSPDPAPEAAP